MISYACRTGTRTTLAALRAAGWRLLLTAGADIRPTDFRYALDNGAWGCHQRGEPFNEMAFVSAVQKVGQNADWIVAPDIVCGGLGSLGLSLSWLPRLLKVGPRVLIPLQDGMVFDDLAQHVDPMRVGVFVGGSSDWKDAAIWPWGRWCRERAIYCHVGRVNSIKRYRLCVDGQVSSFDGSGVVRYPDEMLGRFDRARQMPIQMSMFNPQEKHLAR